MYRTIPTKTINDPFSGFFAGSGPAAIPSLHLTDGPTLSITCPSCSPHPSTKPTTHPPATRQARARRQGYWNTSLNLLCSDREPLTGRNPSYRAMGIWFLMGSAAGVAGLRRAKCRDRGTARGGRYEWSGAGRGLWLR
ncbi:hypothetical protein GWI33_011931 [Rhynchophorus ferrugineus]|uniref:Uncharacterized protein n=1 Tax=Rhynchophorus ferrugineus TaxID=354439 RepID=A0A834IRT3_RHYFE|nr:hypothetical protein GWI33_011931 [Rhynchophorus ferrugineus]